MNTKDLAHRLLREGFATSATQAVAAALRQAGAIAGTGRGHVAAAIPPADVAPIYLVLATSSGMGPAAACEALAGLVCAGQSLLAAVREAAAPGQPAPLCVEVDMGRPLALVDGTPTALPGHSAPAPRWARMEMADGSCRLFWPRHLGAAPADPPAGIHSSLVVIHWPALAALVAEVEQQDQRAAAEAQRQRAEAAAERQRRLDEAAAVARREKAHAAVASLMETAEWRGEWATGWDPSQPEYWERFAHFLRIYAGRNPLWDPEPCLALAEERAAQARRAQAA